MDKNGDKMAAAEHFIKERLWGPFQKFHDIAPDLADGPKAIETYLNNFELENSSALKAVEQLFDTLVNGEAVGDFDTWKANLTDFQQRDLKMRISVISDELKSGGRAPYVLVMPLCVAFLELAETSRWLSCDYNDVADMNLVCEWYYVEQLRYPEVEHFVREHVSHRWRNVDDQVKEGKHSLMNRDVFLVIPKYFPLNILRKAGRAPSVLNHALLRLPPHGPHKDVHFEPVSPPDPAASFNEFSAHGSCPHASVHRAASSQHGQACKQP
eukprot:m.197472 g.197472  ORF g.197472 m.197472 type:complete len:269 (-) comp10645_c1_seq1:182-988(-)